MQKSRYKKGTLLKEIYQDIVLYGKRNDDRFCYSADRRLIIVNSYHPAYRFHDGEEAYYNRMRNAVEAYFDEIPNLLCNQVNKLCFSNR